MNYNQKKVIIHEENDITLIIQCIISLFVSLFIIALFKIDLVWKYFDRLAR